MGFVQRLIRSDHMIRFRGKKLFVNHRVKGSYDYLLIGHSNEPETHLFLDKVITDGDVAYSFIDVGASVGEMVLGISVHPNIEKIYAFEPREDCAYAINKSIELNKESRITVINKAIGETPGKTIFYYRNSGSGSGIHNTDNTEEEGEQVAVTTLDLELPETMPNPILLIDVEGYEPFVIKGGNKFISRNKPLIIFEYNNTSKQHFHVSEIQSLLGTGYSIYRMTQKGTLDHDMDNTWNCVAVPVNTHFEELCRNLNRDKPSLEKKNNIPNGLS